MKKHKILFHINSMGKGGAERVVSVLSKYFVRDGYEVVIVTLWKAEEEYALAEGVRRIDLGEFKERKGRIARALGRFVDLRRIIRQEDPDLVISFCNKANFRSAYSMIGLKTPLLVSVRNDPQMDYAPYRRATSWMEKKAAGCVFQTPDARAFFEDGLQKKSRLIYNPIDEKYLAKVDGVEERGNYIVTVGRLSKQKNQMLLLKAFATAAQDFPQLELRIYGEESDDHVKEDLNAYIEAAGLQTRVHFMGQSDHLEKEIRDAALFVLPSDYEGMPNALMEAMAMGIPVIATDCPCGGTRMLIEDGVSGILIPVRDTEQLTNAMRSLLSDPDQAERMGERAKKIIQIASPRMVYEAWKSYVEELIK